MTVGRNIRALRRQKCLTLEDLSALCGISRDELARYERGEVTPRPKNVARLAAALGVPIVSVRDGIGWTADQTAEGWETEASAGLLRDGIRETLLAGGLTLPEEDISALLEAVKASIPALVSHMRDQRPEVEITQSLLAELGLTEDPIGLTDEQWAQIQPLLPPERTGRGRAFKSNRLMLEGILYWMNTGISWPQLPERFGRSRCVADRLRLWQKAGVWEPVQQKLVELGLVREDGSYMN